MCSFWLYPTAVVPAFSPGVTAGQRHRTMRTEGSNAPLDLTLSSSKKEDILAA